ncbi:ABC transporter permease [Microbacterium sp. DT81.1]|uniref:ABC transporter permease n=1 Tax=Microbacterium sp. DT81.1 TaxID=3393413 RepID=UPI003CE7995E
MTAAIRSELTKVFTTAIWWILAVVLVLYVGMLAAGMAGLFGALSTGQLGSEAGSPPPDPAGLPLVMYSIATSIGYVFPLLIGTLIVTSEFRHQTLTPTFLATPARGIALAAKVAAGIVLGLLFGVIAVVSAVGPAAGILAAYDIDPLLSSGDTWLLLGRAILALVLWAIIGIGIGAVVRNQVVAIVIVLAFTQVVEPVLRIAGGLIDWLGELTKYLPGAASDALVGQSFFTGLGGPSAAPVATLEWWVGGLVLLGYAVVLLVIGNFTSWHRDVT